MPPDVRHDVARTARTIAPGVTLARADYPVGMVQPRHHDSCVQISLVLRGGVREATADGEVEASPLDVLCKGFELPHADVFATTTPTRLLSIRLDPAAHPSPELALERVIPLGTWRCQQAAPELLDVFRLGTLALDGYDAVVDPTLLALDFQALFAAPPAARGTLPPWLLRLRERLRAECRRPVSLAALSADAGLHPVTVSRAFRQHFGETASQYLTRHRVREAAARMARGDALSSIAYDAGFADQSHMARQFRRSTGMTPGAFRAWLRPVGTPTVGTPRVPGARRAAQRRPLPLPDARGVGRKT